MCSHIDVQAHLKFWSVDHLLKDCAVSPSRLPPLIWPPLFLFLWTVFLPLCVTPAHSQVLHTQWMQRINTLVHARGELCRLLTASCFVSLPMLRCQTCLHQAATKRKRSELCLVWALAPLSVLHTCVSFISFLFFFLFCSCLSSPLTMANQWRLTALWWRSLSSSPLESPSSPRRSTGLPTLQLCVIWLLGTRVIRATGPFQGLISGCLMLFSFQCYHFVNYRLLNYLQWPWRCNLLWMHCLVRTMTVLYCSLNTW